MLPDRVSNPRPLTLESDAARSQPGCHNTVKNEIKRKVHRLSLNFINIDACYMYKF